MDAYRPLACEAYDYLEIACMRGYVLQVECRDGQTLTARALTLRTAKDGEFLLLQGEGEPFELRLDQLQAITPVSAGAGFGRILLAPGY